jgi:hypothetical protein
MFSGMLARRGSVTALLLPSTEARGLHASAALYSKATRKALTGKRANKNYYKGKGRSASTPHRPIGRRTKHGNYVIDAPRDAHRLYARTANGEEMWGVHVDGHGNGDDAQMTHVSERYRVRLPEHDRQEDALAQAIFEHQLRVYMPEAYGRAAASRQLKAPVPSPAAGLSELSAAAAAGDLGAVRALLESGADASAVDGDGGGGGEGRTALHHAAAGGHRAVVVELLYSSDPGALDGGARTAAQLAARAGHLDTVRTLLQGGGGGGAAADAGGAGEEGALGAGWWWATPHAPPSPSAERATRLGAAPSCRSPSSWASRTATGPRRSRWRWCRRCRKVAGARHRRSSCGARWRRRRRHPRRLRRGRRSAGRLRRRRCRWARW